MFNKFCAEFYYCILPIAGFIGLLYFKKVDKPFKWLCLLLMLTPINELVAGYLSNRRIPNGIVYIVFTPVEYFMYAMIYGLFFNTERWKKILYGSVAGLIVLEILNTIFLQGLNKTPTNIMNIENVLLVILSLKLFIGIRENPVYENILTEGVFWFNSVVLLYYSFDVLFWGLHSLIYQLKNPPLIIYQIILLFSGLLYIAYAAAVLLNRNAVIKTAVKYE